MTKLPKVELGSYFAIWTGCVLYAIYNFTKSANIYFQNYENDLDFTTGWFLSRKQDIADYEWEPFKFFLKISYFWYIIHVSTSEILRKFNLKILNFWQISLSLLFIWLNFGFKTILLLVFQPIIFTIIGNFAKHSTLVWFFESLIIYLLYLIKDISVMKWFSTTSNRKDESHLIFITIISLFWMNLKCLSYTLDKTNKKQEFNKTEFLWYCLYLPTMFFGPFIQYKEFKTKTVPFSERFPKLIFNIARFSFWFLFTEICLHFIYVNVTGFYPEWVETLDLWSLCGYGYTMGQFFHLKYLIMYGISTTLAQFDNINTPSLPKCIGRIHLYSDMWRYFDNGLYNFLVKYIYIPTMNNSIFPKNELLSSLFCFSFVFIWHGKQTYILVWTLLNFTGITIEYASKKCFNNYLKHRKLVKRLKPFWIRRLICLIASPLLAMSAISNFYFFAQMDIGNIFLAKIIKADLIGKLAMFGILYCCCQISTELKQRNIKKQQ